MGGRNNIFGLENILGEKSIKSGLIYTKKCGWLDLGHANPLMKTFIINIVNKIINL